MPDGLCSQDGELVAAAARDVLETMFFAMIEEEIPEPTGGDTLYTRVSFGGEWSGTFWMAIPAESASAMASDFLGLFGEEASTDQIRHVQCELANMICGTALSRLHNDGAFDLKPPEVITADGYQPASESLAVELPLEHGVVKLALECHG